MSTECKKYEPSPIEFFHSELQDEFHKLRLNKTKSLFININGSEFNNIVVAAKKTTYDKYKELNPEKPILKSDLIKYHN